MIETSVQLFYSKVWVFYHCLAGTCQHINAWPPLIVSIARLLQRKASQGQHSRLAFRPFGLLFLGEENAFDFCIELDGMHAHLAPDAASLIAAEGRFGMHAVI